MAIYLKKFENHTQYENYINGSDAILPNVSICTTEDDVHYNPLTPPTPIETRLVAKLYVSDTSDSTKIANNITSFSSIEIDGVEQPSVVSAYTFSTEGEHTVKYTLKNASIGISAFNYCTGLTSIYIPDSVTSIGDDAFQACTSLTSIDIPNSVTSIGEYAFSECAYITNCTIGSGITSIGDKAFYNNSSLDSVTIMATTPPTTTSDVFGGEMNLTTIYVPSASVETYKAASGWSDYASRIQAIP